MNYNDINILYYIMFNVVLNYYTFVALQKRMSSLFSSSILVRGFQIKNGLF